MSHLGRFIEGIEIGNVLVQTANINLETGDTSLVSINIQSSNLTSISLPLLATIANTSNNTVIVGNNFLTSIDLHSLVSAPNLQITGNNAICSVDLHSFTTGDGNQFLCTSIDLTSLSTTNTNSNGFQIQNLTQSTLDLPALTTVGDGMITLSTTSSQTIDGITTQSLTSFQSLTVQSDSSNWIII